MNPRQWPRGVRDVAVVLGWCGLDLALSFDQRTSGALLLSWTAAYALLGYLLLLARHRWPLAVFAALLAHSMLAAVVTPSYLPTLDLWVCLFTVAARSRIAPAAMAALATVGPLTLTALAQWAQHPGLNPIRTVVAGIVFWVVVTVAVLAAGRRLHRTTHERALAAAEAERAAADAAAQAVGTERARIARDLHDVVSHSLTLMTLQAGVAGRLLKSNPAAAVQALDGVGELGEQAGTELHRLLGLWENQSEPAGQADQAHQAERRFRGDIAPGRRPGPTTGRDLVTLTERARAAMPNLVLTVHGLPTAQRPQTGIQTPGTGVLRPETGDTAYRVLQEALTNASRFADPDLPIAVTVDWAPDEVTLTVANHVRRTPCERPGVDGGRGLSGMDRRVRDCGGRLSVRTTGDGTFTLSVRLPVTTRTAATTPPGRRARASKALLASVPSLFF